MCGKLGFRIVSAELALYDTQVKCLKTTFLKEESDAAAAAAKEAPKPVEVRIFPS